MTRQPHRQKEVIAIPWFKVDDKFHSHPKVMELPTSAIGVWTLAGTWCADYLTDGEIRPGHLRRLGGTEEDAALLVEAGLWETTEDGYRFRDWTDYQPTREAVTADKEVSKRRWAMNNNPELRKVVRGRDGDTCRYCQKRVNWSDRRSAEGGTYDHVLPLSKGGDESPENIVVACRDCNVRKGARTPDQAGITLHPPKSNLDKSQNTPRSVNSHTKPPEPVPEPVPVPNPLEREKPRKKSSTAIPASWEPTETHEKKAHEKGVDLAGEAERFKLHAETHDRKCVNWNSAFTMWLSKARPPTGQQQYMNSAEKKVDVAKHWLSQPAQAAPEDPWAISATQRKEISQ